MRKKIVAEGQSKGTQASKSSVNDVMILEYENVKLRIFFLQRKEAKARKHRSHRSLENPGSGQTLLMQVNIMLNMMPIGGAHILTR